MTKTNLLLRWTGALALTLLTAAAAAATPHQALLRLFGPAATPPPAFDPDQAVGPPRQWLYLPPRPDPAGPPRLVGGQRYALAFAPRPGAAGQAVMRLRWARRWRFALTRDVPLRMGTAAAPPPVLHRVPAPAPWAVAYEADLLPGRYALAFGPGAPPTVDFLAEPLAPPTQLARE